ncbi:hypothetical protein SteCoe_9054 [Stentor coeruleus]|uniref:Guanylate cyclase domain-containing protein n=1 Tax=Stentor coeruleus TaxID=5963 RepID=A0A1R2CJ14_9CILI|nr:hypothetical protein SteCoe_9054 [Stentor coeruleus]
MESKKKAILRDITLRGNIDVTTSIYPGNQLILSRWSWWTFIPRNLFEQFQRVSNIWFLIVSIFQLIPYQLNPTDSWTTIVPLSILLLISLLKAAYYDYMLDKKLILLNNTNYQYWDGEKFSPIKSQDIVVGQFIEIEEDQVIPADMILASKQKEGHVFLDMSRLLGFTIQREKKTIEKLEKLINSFDGELPGIVRVSGKVKVAEPNSDYNNFYGTLKLDLHPSAIELNSANILYSGGILKGEGPIIGFVVYCGIDSRILLNADPYKKKISRIEEKVNKWVLYILIIQALLVLGSVLGFYYANNYTLTDYNPLEPIITFTLLYNNIIPISLFMVIDIIRLLQSFLFKRKTKSHIFNTDDVSENLGQIDYLVTDKTNSLTEKNIVVKSCTIGEKLFEYDEENDFKEIIDSFDAPASTSPRHVGNSFGNFTDLKNYLLEEVNNTHVTNFMKCLCLANNLDQHNNEYLGSKEEIAMVELAANFGFKLSIYHKKRLDLTYGQTVASYKVVSNSPLSKNKNKSRVLLEELISGCGVLFLKGTPEVMLPLLNIGSEHLNAIKEAAESLEDRNCQVFIMAYKKISLRDIKEYKSKFKKIRKSLLNNEGRVEGIFRTLEKHVKYLGIISLCEELLKDTHKVLQKLQNAGIKVWLASSDNFTETFSTAKESRIIDPCSSILAIKDVCSEISVSRILLKGVQKFIYGRSEREFLHRQGTLGNHRRTRVKMDNEQKRQDCDGNTEEKDDLSNYRPQISNNLVFRSMTHIDIDVDKELGKAFNPNGIDYSVIIDRCSFKIALKDEDCRKLLVCVLACAKSVCFTDLMPRDKGNVVKLIKENFSYKPVVAAVGSGEGDINMLQIADVGIGINHNKHSLAMNYCDAIVTHFSDIDQLILVYGHYTYTRISKAIFLFLYKNCLLTIILLAFTFLCSYSGTSIFNASLLVGYNIFFTTLPIIIIGIFDEDLSAKKIMLQPQVYSIGIHNSMFNWKKLLTYAMISSVQGVILIILCYVASPGISFTNGSSDNIIELGTSIYITLIVVVLLQIYIETYCYTILYYFSICFSIVCLLIFISIESRTDFPDTELFGVGLMITKSPFSFFSICFSSVACIIPVYFYYNYIELFKPKVIEKLKSGHNLLAQATLKISYYSSSLLSLYRQSDKWKNKLQTQKFSLNKKILQFTFSYIEKKYALSFLEDNIRMFKFTFILLWILLLIWTIFGVTFRVVTLSYTLARIAMLASCSIVVYMLWTSAYQKNYRFYTCGVLLITLLVKFGLEASFNSTSFLATALVPSITFMILTVHWVAICLLNLLNLILFVISLSIEYSEKYSSSNAALLIINSFIVLCSIAITSSIKGYYCESARRTEHILMNKARAGIDKTHSILSIMLPQFVKNRVKDGVRYISENQGDVSVLFCDICDFDKICKDYRPEELTCFLDKLFSNFDSLCELTGVTKIETVGKTYMACAGLKDSDKEMPMHLRKESHARRAVEFAFAIIEEVNNIQLKNGNNLQVKIGINSGQVSAGVVGYHKPQFSLVGDTVNTASRMCSTLDQPNSIQIAASTQAILKDYQEFMFIPRIVFAKGKGDIQVYIITESKPDNSDIAGGLGTTLQGPSTLMYSVNSANERSFADEIPSETPAIRRDNSRGSRTWKENILKKSDKDAIDYQPSILPKFSVSKREKEFQLKRLEGTFAFVFFSLIIATITFSLLLILAILQYFITESFDNEGIIIGKSIIVIYLLIIVSFFKFIANKIIPEVNFDRGETIMNDPYASNERKGLDKKYNRKIIYPILMFPCLCIMMIEIMIYIPYGSSIPSDFIGLEVMYIILLLCHTSEGSIFIISLANTLLFIPWIILAFYSNDLSLHLTNAFLAAGFSVINLKAIYSQEKHDRINFNLAWLAEKEIRDNVALLVQMMPPHVLDHLEKDQAFTDRLHAVTLIFADIVGFTDWSSHKSPNQIVEMLSNLFTRFDKLCVEYDVYKVHTIGDCYVVMGDTGKKTRNPSQECLNVIKMAHRMIDVIKEENIKHSSNLNMRIGVHTGDVIAGVIGTSIVRYDIWGPDVLIANKMESNGKPGYIKISSDTKEMLESRIQSGFIYEESDKLEVPAIGVTKRTYFLNCEDINSLVFITD